MKNIHSLNTSPEGLQPSALVDQLKETADRNACILEVRTADGPVYLRPTGWQRFCLQRAFRHFRVLPPQVLGTSNQRRIENLLATSVYKPDRPVREDEVFGIVEQVHAGSQSQGVKAARASAPAPEPATVAAPVVVPAGMALVQSPAVSGVTREVTRLKGVRPAVVVPARSSGFVVQDGRLWHWIVAGAAAAACIPLIMGTVYGISTLSSTPQVSAQAVVKPVQQVASQPAHATLAAPTAPAIVSTPEKRRRRLTPGGTQAELLNASATSAMTAVQPPRFVSELPPGHFAHPNTTGSLAGEVRLKAMIGADGSVKQVTVLSGDPRLAQAAERAVMRWHYSPYGGPVAAETEIRMRFFGTDAVSIASVAGPAS